VQDFKNLKVWEKSHKLTMVVYKFTMRFPKEELYGITGQIRRASVSIPTNIAEGCGRTGDNEFRRFLQIAMGSASELEYLLLLAAELRYIDESTFLQSQKEIVEIKQMLTALIKKLTLSKPKLNANS